MTLIDVTTGELVDVPLSASERAALDAHEAVIARGLQTFYDVGNALLAIRDDPKKLYREYGTFEDYCQQRWGMSRPRAYQFIEAATVVANLSTIGRQNGTEINERQARELAPLAPDEQRLVWDVVRHTAPGGKVTAQHVKSVVNVLKEVTSTGAIDDGTGIHIPVAQATPEHLKAAVTEETYERMARQEQYIADKLETKSRREHALEVMNTSENNEWYTPERYVAAARALMGGIELDPATSEYANETVQAERIYTARDDGLAQDWTARSMWLNPPYGYAREGGVSNQELWTARLIQEYQRGCVQEAVLLVNAVTDRQWFQPLWDYPICFTDHRIRFYGATGEPGSPTVGSVLVYFGTRHTAFVEQFRQFGVIVRVLARRV